jgi:hypothetical protein
VSQQCTYLCKGYACLITKLCIRAAQVMRRRYVLARDPRHERARRKAIEAQGKGEQFIAWRDRVKSVYASCKAMEATPDASLPIQEASGACALSLF